MLCFESFCGKFSLWPYRRLCTEHVSLYSLYRHGIQNMCCTAVFPLFSSYVGRCISCYSLLWIATEMWTQQHRHHRTVVDRILYICIVHIARFTYATTNYTAHTLWQWTKVCRTLKDHCHLCRLSWHVAHISFIHHTIPCGPYAHSPTRLVFVEYNSCIYLHGALCGMCVSMNWTYTKLTEFLVVVYLHSRQTVVYSTLCSLFTSYELYRAIWRCWCYYHCLCCCCRYSLLFSMWSRTINVAKFPLSSSIRLDQCISHSPHTHSLSRYSLFFHFYLFSASNFFFNFHFGLHLFSTNGIIDGMKKLHKNLVEIRPKKNNENLPIAASTMLLRGSPNWSDAH